MIRFTKYMLGMAAATFAFSFILAAQPARMSPQERTEKMTKDLSLSKEQQAKVLSIFTSAQDKTKAVFDEHQGDREAMRPLMQKIRQDTDDQLKKVLTTEQYETWQKQRSDAPGRPRRGAAPDSGKAKS
jgi:Spy/CpxP family protein refolding chaperone